MTRKNFFAILFAPFLPKPKKPNTNVMFGVLNDKYKIYIDPYYASLPIEKFTLKKIETRQLKGDWTWERGNIILNGVEIKF